jgi:glyoxylase-like metal-dependent hydrolase (beta-lactamase superfamily II)
MSEHRGAITHEGERYPSPRHGLDYLDGDPPEPGHARQIGERLWWARIPLPMELNHINVWLVDEGDHWTLVDTGMAEQVCREAWDSLDATVLGGRPIGRVFITHDHPDHLGLAPWLAARHGAKVWMSAFAHQAVADYLATSTEALRDRSYAFVSRNGMHIAPEGPQSKPRGMGDSWFGGVPPLDRACVDGELLAGGGRDWKLIETDGHCRGHLCLHDAAGDVLISGDQVLPTISPNVSVISVRPEGDPLRDFLVSLARLEQCSAGTLVLPSHGRPFRGLHRRISAVRAHHMEQLESLRVACGEPKTAFELVPVMFGRTLRGFHRFLALGETLAHLHYLWHGGELARSTDESGVIRFQIKQAAS